MIKKFISIILLPALIVSAVDKPQVSEVKVQGPEKMLIRANELYVKDRYEAAIRLYRRAMNRGADAGICRFNMGNAYFQMVKYPEAAANFRQALLERDGNFPAAAFNLGAVFYRMGDFGTSVAVYRRALRLDPSRVSAWLYLAEAYIKTGDYSGAQLAYEKALALDPRDISIVLALAEVHVSIGDLERAIELAREGYSRKSDEIRYLIYVGDIERTRKNFAQAAGIYREALVRRPDDIGLLYKLADVLELEKLPYAAMDVLKKSIAIDPEFADGLIFLGNLAFDANWRDLCESSYKKLVEMKNNQGLQGLMNLMDVYGERSMQDKALELGNWALQYFPNHRELQRQLEQLQVEENLVNAN
jgi:tetratricopeptide (TPR) repeat protein